MLLKNSYKILLVAIALFLLLGLSGCGESGNTPNQEQAVTDQPETETTDQDQISDEEQSATDAQTGSNLLTIEADTIEALQSEKLNFANKKANDWQSNSKLVAVQVEVPSSLRKENVSTRYIYSSPSVNYYYWTIAISADNTSYIRALIPKEDYLNSNLDIILNDFWKFNYVQALQIADENGGSDWRETNNLGQVTMVLSRGQPNNYHYWNIEYVAVDEDGQRIDSNNFKLKISSYSGEIVE